MAGKRLAYAWGALGLLFALLATSFGMGHGWADMDTAQTRAWVTQWRNGTDATFNDETYQQSVQTLQQAIDSSPRNAQLYADLGFLYVLRANALTDPDSNAPLTDEQRALWKKAAATFEAETRVAPSLPYAWVHLAMALNATDKGSDAMWAAWDRAVQFGVNESDTQINIAAVALSNWQQMNAPRRQQLAAMVRNANPTVAMRLKFMAYKAGVFSELSKLTSVS